MRDLNGYVFRVEIISLLWIVGLFAYGPSMVWEKTYGQHASGSSVLETSDGGYIVVGSVGLSAASHDIWLLKTDQNGDTLWTRTYGGTQDDIGRSVQIASDGGYMIIGYTASYGAGAYDGYLIRTDSLGNVLWAKTYGGSDNEFLGHVQKTNDNGYILAGATKSFGAGDYDIYGIKVDSCGNIVWTKTYGGMGLDGLGSVQQSTDGGYIFAGWSESYGTGDADVYLVRTTSLGDTLWTKTYGGTHDEVCYDIEQVFDGGYITTGFVVTEYGGSFDVQLIRMNINGDTLWTRCFSSVYLGIGRSVIETPDSSFVTAGTYGNYWYNVWLLKVNNEGDTMWTAEYGGAYHDEDGSSVQMTADGGFIITGQRNNDHLYLVKTSPDPTGHGIRENNYTNLSLLNVEVSPNPFRNKTDIKLTISDYGLQNNEYSLEIYDVTGCIVKDFAVSTPCSLVPFIISWDGYDDCGRKVPSGVYFLRLQAGNYTETRKLLLVR